MSEETVEKTTRPRINREVFFDAVVNAVEKGMTKRELAESLGVKEATITQRMIKMNLELKNAGMETYRLKSGTGGRKAESFADIAKAKLEAIKSL